MSNTPLTDSAISGIMPLAVTSMLCREFESALRTIRTNAGYEKPGTKEQYEFTLKMICATVDSALTERE